MFGKLAIGAIGCFAFPFSAVATTAEQATQFDLLCEGQAAFRPGMRPVASSLHYRISIQEMRWCWERCERTFPLVSATVDRITFNEDANGGYHSYVSRIDGTYSRTNFGRGGGWINEQGTCRPAPFSGMPQPRF